MDSANFGNYLRTLRKRNDLTINQLEELTGISNAYISQIETGKRGVPSSEILKKLCLPLKVSHQPLMIEAGYLKEPTTFPEHVDLGKLLLQQNNIFFRGIQINAKQRKILLDILEQFTDNEM
ncbi:Transcriptional regulator, contains XRE-family HTH domain [Gracilibacillus ureilyticus]|uniref:Transcriptional regulator, contains XRE-family HTH domain n=1 Tax=Gracilibacillus ureilyticus TaxID=531814 RepID=A0A1H9T750_9BACI|nr:helix-turn-helix transcriptional regulator [Gracilibacillus ureilyticus]SER92956.1 Transcriptional regulator, contains XRE-family HTH domain [Gracilibacillus ureilyticus]